MATLVLTAVGSAIGGPIGGALGSLIGQSVDRAVLFRPGRREGPRLTELAVQTSSYGSQIPRLFGRVRVAGTVIWATDLIETRSVARGGKGAPGVANYSYAASFAVLLSARAIRGVGRVWADGKLLRGAAGDMKAAGAMRVHLGGAAQDADPLIASAEGALAPAHRGHAYAVFEGLALADFGNRIPSLTFEVIADEAPVPVGAIAREMAIEVSGEVSGADGVAFDGFAAGGGSVRAVLETLALAGGWFAPEAAGVRLYADDAPVTATLIDAGVAADGRRGGRRRRTVAPVATVPRTVMLGHYDPARDYQAGVQRATRPGAGVREDRVELPAVIAAAPALALAQAMLARAEAGRTRRTLSLGFAGLGLVPGMVVDIVGEGGRWRIEDVTTERMVTTVVLVPVMAGPGMGVASGGRVLGAPDRIVGRTILRVAELPALDDRALVQPRLTVVAAGVGAGWRSAPLLMSLDDGVSWQAAGGTAAPGVVGTIETPLASASATLVDRRHAVVVRLARDDMVLGDADAAALDRGANLALAGAELIQFGRAVPLGNRRWRLEELWRGRRGTPRGAGAGADFALIEADQMATIDLPLGAIGGRVRIMAAGIGDGDTPEPVAIMVTGASVAPPAPVGLHATPLPGGDVAIGWTRRSRIGWGWHDGVDAPLGEERELYRIELAAGDVRWSEEVAEPRLVVPAARVVPGLTVAVRQRGTLTESPAATLTVHSGTID